MSRLALYCLGTFRVERDGAMIAPDAFGTQKTRALLKLLLTARGHALTQDQLIEYLWMDLEPAAAGRNLRVAVSQLRRVLEPALPRGSHSRYILTTETGYAWNVAAAYELDADEFQTRCAEFETAADADGLDRAVTIGEAARALYQGDYLEADRYAEWATAERERLREIYLALVTRLAEAHARQCDWHRALALCRQVLAVDNCRESVWRQLMLYHYHAGDHAAALRAYDECRRVLAEEIGVEPMDATRELRERLVRGAIPPPQLAIPKLQCVDRLSEVHGIRDCGARSRADPSPRPAPRRLDVRVYGKR